MVAALALLATLLTAVVVARGLYTRQTAMSERRIAAAAAADRLLTDWTLGEGIPPTASGRTLSPAGSAFAWRTSPVANPAAEVLGATVIRLEMTEPNAVGPPLVSVEVMSRDPDR